MNLLMKSVRDLRRFQWADLGDLDCVADWPLPVKAGILLSLFVACLGAGHFFHLKQISRAIQVSVNTEEQLIAEFEQTAARAASLGAYRAQIIEMEATLSRLLRHLPSETEIPELVDDVTAAGESSGLVFASLALQPEVTGEFYIELPIDITVTGGYHDFGNFVSGIASLDRIVTLHDFHIQALAGSTLQMDLAARTYRYLETSERKAEE